MPAILKTIACFLLLTGSLLSGKAQSIGLEANNDVPLEFAEKSSFSLYADQDPRIFYIDFETISAKIETVVIEDREGTRVWEANVFDLPGNAIYELTLHHLAPGQYNIKLKMFNQELTQDLFL